jgi:hypothetical protein
MAKRDRDRLYIVYYEPRRSSVDLSSRGGRQSYFGVARVDSVIEDEKLADHFFAIIDGSTYLDFDTAVPFFEGEKYYESALEKDDGSTNKGAFGRAVRLIPDDEFDRIFKSGFAPTLGENLTPPRIYSARPIGSSSAIRAACSRNDGFPTVPRTILHVQRARGLFESMRDYRPKTDKWRRRSS